MSIEENMDEDEIAEYKISYGRWRLESEFPFFSSLSYQLKVVKKSKERCPTMGVDRKGVLGYNEDFVKEMDRKDMTFLIAHEVMHVALSHHSVMKRRIKQLKNEGKSKMEINQHLRFLNIAGDYAINGILDKQGFKVDRNRFLLDEQFYGMSMEEIYNYLIENQEEIEINIQQMTMEEMLEQFGEGDDSETVPMPFDRLEEEFEDEENENIVGETDEEIKEEWEQKMHEAYKHHKARGKKTGGIKQLIDNIDTEKINWRAYLRKELKSFCKNKYNTLKPSRRGMVHGYHLPSIEGEEMSVTVALDTSGSMTKQDLADALSEVIGIMRSGDNVNVTFLMHDTDVKKVIEIDGRRRSNKLMNDDRFEVVGRGGTDHRPVFEWIKENKKNTRNNVLVCFTDAYSRFPENKPYGLRTIWVINSNSDVPFGEVIRMED